MKNQTVAEPIRIEESDSKAREPAYLTLCDLIATVSELTEEDDQLTAKIIAHMLNSGKVKLIGSFRGKKLAFV